MKMMITDNYIAKGTCTGESYLHKDKYKLVHFQDTHTMLKFEESPIPLPSDEGLRSSPKMS